MNGTTRAISASASTLSPGPALTPPDVDDVGAVGDDPVRGGPGRLVAEGRAAVVERIRGAVDDRHDQRRDRRADRAAAQGGLHPSIVPGRTRRAISRPTVELMRGESPTRCRTSLAADSAGGPQGLSPAVAYRPPPRRDIRRRTAHSPRRGRPARRADLRCRGRRPARADPPCGS